jgi:uncharacterized iron-regulated membrane protein
MADNRTWHRWVSIPCAAFFVVIAVTGVGLQLDMWIEGKSPPGSEPPPPPVAGKPPAEVQTAITRGIARVEEAHPGKRITTVGLDRAGRTLTVGLKDSTPASVKVDLASGKVSAGPPPPGENRGWHYILQDIHAGYFAGPFGRVLSTLAGLGLLFLSFTGFMVYWNLFRRRWKMGRKGPFWR